MGEPTRIRYLSPWFVPRGEHLRKKIVRGRHLVLHFPKLLNESSLAALLNKLREELPENYEVFDAGTMRDSKRVTVMEVISKEEVSSLAPLLLTAARSFRADADLLAHQLAELNGVPVSELFAQGKNITIFPKGWEVCRHGIHDCFTHQLTGQQVEVCVVFGTEFGVLDPYFFYQYMATTQGIGAPKQLVEPYHDTRRALEFLEANGSLKRITRAEWETGVFAPG